jgi:hypothetical protein
LFAQNKHVETQLKSPAKFWNQGEKLPGKILTGCLGTRICEGTGLIKEKYELDKRVG